MEKAELISIAQSLQSAVDRLLECSKSDKKEEKKEDKPSGDPKTLAFILKKKMGK